jgi:cytosine/adenosine deaminase-related metal-dependent hydrolase
VDAKTVKSGPGARAYGAKWVWCGPGRLLERAWVVLQAGRVREIAGKPPAGVESHDLGPGLLLPGLVNAHTHLELSFLADFIDKPKGDFMAWLETLVSLRPGYDRGQAKEAARLAAKFAADQGTVLAGDITNTGRAAWAWAEAGVSVISFFEAIGPARSDPPQPEMKWDGNYFSAQAVASHAPYSVPSWRQQALKELASSIPIPLSIHLAESRAEMEFFAGQGAEGARMEDFLVRRGLQKADMDLRADTPLAHLLSLGLVDGQTLLVHGVQLTPEELAQVAIKGASLCLCPRSNLGLTGGVADAPAALKAGVNLSLGTDSLASCPDLSLWAEMRKLMEIYPGLDAEVVLAMATTGGAKALGMGEHFGLIAPGYCAPLVYVPLEGMSENEALPAAISQGGGAAQLVMID